MREILLTQGKTAIIDNADFKIVARFKWCAHKGHNTFYASTNIIKDGKSKSVRMHRLLLGLTDSKILTDHRDGDGLNNRRSNIRICNKGQNQANRRSHKNATSKYLGVHVHNSGGAKYWAASLTSLGKRIFAKTFPFTDAGEIAAAKAYDEAAKKAHAEFANLNFK